MLDLPAFEVLEGDPASPVIVHVPHASRAIPADVRAGILLDDAELADELDRMTDARTDELAALVAASARPTPWRFVNRRSRLVVDPERFPDEREELLAVGMGAVYTRTSDGRPLRHPDPSMEAALVAVYFEPYARAFADLVDDRLRATGRALIIDLHSYPAVALPYELHQHARRPAVCLGVDAFHTPPPLLERATRAFQTVGEVTVDEPFVGTYVPLRHYGTDARVASLMVELRRDAYLAADGSLDGARADVIVQGIRAVLAYGASP